MARYGIVVDLNRCIGCHGCEVACKNENGVELGEYWNRVVDCGPYGDYPDIEMYFLPTMCQQCENAPCVSVCPTGASYRNEDGIVLVDAESCIGCQLCMDACPYGARSYNAKANAVHKCTLCSHLPADDREPMCVRTCSAGARYFGDLDDPQSRPAQVLEAVDPESVFSLSDTGNAPVTRYVLSPKRAAWRDGVDTSLVH